MHRGQGWGAVIGPVVVIIVAVVVAQQILPVIFPPPLKPPVEITDLRIGGLERGTQAKNGDYTDITFTLKNNDGKDHQLTVVFEMTAEGIRHVSITNPGREELARSDTRFQYTKAIGSTDPYLREQKVLAFAKMQPGLSSVSVEIRIILIVDGKAVGDPQTLTLNISK
mgnify:CR=1 FL=1